MGKNNKSEQNREHLITVTLVSKQQKRERTGSLCLGNPLTFLEVVWGGGMGWPHFVKAIYLSWVEHGGLIPNMCMLNRSVVSSAL